MREVMRQPFVATASDGSTHIARSGEVTHPRAYGTFPRKIRYALDEKIITLEEAIRSCTGLPAEILGLPDRGILRARRGRRRRGVRPRNVSRCGNVRSADPVRPGLKHLFVNGKPLIAGGDLVADSRTKTKLPGRALRHSATARPR